LGGHPSEVQERAAEDAAACAERPIGEREREVPHPDTPVRGVEKVREEGAELAEPEREPERQESERPDDRAQQRVLETGAQRARSSSARDARTTPRLWRERRRRALGRNDHGPY